MISFLRKLLALYAFLLALDFALTFLANSQQRWMAVLHRICDPAIRLGRRVIDRLVPDRKTSMDLGEPVAFVLCILIRMILGWF